jgi:WD40 repeat protein
LQVLRNELAPLLTTTTTSTATATTSSSSSSTSDKSTDLPARLHHLARALASSDPLFASAVLNMTQSVEESRHHLVEQVLQLLPTTVAVPPFRLNHIIAQAQELQRRQCVFHNPNDENHASVLHDHRCQEDAMPSVCGFSLHQHKDEVWMVRFSHNGRFLASASKDHSCIIWSTVSMMPIITLQGHTDVVQYVAWSPDDSLLLTCGGDDDASVRLWSIPSGVCSLVIDRHSQGVTSCAWFPDGSSFFTASTDKSMIWWRRDGTTKAEWSTLRPVDMALLRSATHIIVVCHDHKLRKIQLDGTAKEQTVLEKHAITSLSVSSDDRFALINLSNKTLHVWDIVSMRLVHSYVGHEQARFAIRSCFGGPFEAFIASGSEDGVVYIWNREQEKLVQTLHGHDGPVNSVSWNPKNCGMIASGGDDGFVRVWIPNGTGSRVAVESFV